MDLIHPVKVITLKLTAMLALWAASYTVLDLAVMEYDSPSNEPDAYAGGLHQIQVVHTWANTKWT